MLVHPMFFFLCRMYDLFKLYFSIFHFPMFQLTDCKRNVQVSNLSCLVQNKSRICNIAITFVMPSIQLYIYILEFESQFLRRDSYPLTPILILSSICSYNMQTEIVVGDIEKKVNHESKIGLS